MPINYDSCPLHTKDRKRYKECPVPLSSMCHFRHCDLSSSHVCGDCVHWVGNATFNGEPHKKCGHCYHEIGIVNSYYKCNCPYWFKRPDGFPSYVDWIEKHVQEDILADRSINPKESRKKWYKIWGESFPKNDWWFDPYKIKK